MDILNNILIAIHLLGLVVGMGSGMALSALGPRYGSADDGQRSLLFSIGNGLARNGHIGLGLLWVTGLILVFTKYGDLSAMPALFWVKIVFVVLLSASIGMGSAAYRKFQAGDNSVTGRMAITSKANAALGALIILTAVFAFN